MGDSFVRRLTITQLSQFFEGAGHLCDIKKSHNENMLDVFFMDDDGKTFWYSIADNYICAPDFHKTSEDWKLFMKELFGEEYLQKYAEMPVLNAFIDELSLEDIKKLLERKHLKTETIQECEAFREGTRRFKITYGFPSPGQYEIVLGPHFDYCKGLFRMSEQVFMKFFTQKFGMDFIRFYSEIERRNCEKKVKEYTQKCENKLSQKRQYMVSIWENS